MPGSFTEKIVYIPSTRAGQGSGHFRRALRFSANYGPAAKIYIHPESEHIDYRAIMSTNGTENSSVSNDIGILGDAKMIICDLFRTDPDLFARLAAAAPGVPLAGIDEGGPVRDSFHFLVDTLPGLQKTVPNIMDTGFINPGPAAKRTSASVREGSILVSFGGEDPAGLTGKLIHMLAKTGSSEHFTVISTDCANAGIPDAGLPQNVEIIPHCPDLYSLMPLFGGCITSFGLTAMEASFRGLPCLLFHPTSHHARLARKAGFRCSGRIGVDPKTLAEFTAAINKGNGGIFVNTLPASGKRLLADFFGRSGRKGYTDCPVCGTAGKTLCRTPSRRYAICSSCRLIFMFSLGEQAESYSEAYFDSEYKKQYGKTYLEDFDKIKEMGRSRLGVIGKCISTKERRLLDVGCAYGPFLKAAQEAGYTPSGCDISTPAVDYVNSKPGLRAWLNKGRESVFGKGKYDVISLWYVIEHLENLREFITDAAEHLEKGGIFAFSTPSYRGISGRRSLPRFLAGGPKDHYTVWSPAAAKRVLRAAGFKICRTRVTGHHPERFPLNALFRRGAGYTIMQKISKIAGLGDTFEIYARKK